jgi:hypothetical protein
MTPRVLPRVLPNYSGGSLVNLMASIVEGCGGHPLHAPLDAMPPTQIAGAQNVVLMIVDGLGDGFLARHGGDSELARHRRGTMTSVFPSTTASAITTTYTGCSPLEHGLTGWYTYFGEAGCVAAALPFRSRGDNLSLRARGYTPERAYTARSLFSALPIRSIVITYREIIDSEYNVRHCEGAERRAYTTLDQFAIEIERAVKSGAERKLVYAYWPEYDMTSHRFGSESRAAVSKLSELDACFGNLLERLAGTDSLIIVTADHGFIDVPAEESLELPARLAAQLRFPLCGERRVAYCHVHAPERFLDEAGDWLGGRADVLPSSSLVDEGWFGPGKPHPRFAERIGDVALVMRGRYTIKDWTPGEPRFMHIGNHGGTSADEMTIPLIVTEA